LAITVAGAGSPAADRARRGPLQVAGDQVLVEHFGGGAPAEGLPRAGVQGGGDGGEIVEAVPGKICALGEVLAQQPVGVLVGGALPRAVRIAEVDLQAGVDPQLRVLGQLGALVSGQRPAQLVG
jgi:hypothetical protein